MNRKVPLLKKSVPMSAPLLAKSFGVFLFAMISAIAFATVLGAVSGLIVAGTAVALGIILLSPDMFARYGLWTQPVRL